ncbi:MAG TPA: LysR family transcriptional regulator [Streptosporangiaceae bacterium]|nr:LysR family transcriptional regulator [Streptosporangiaceae bacterium]
MAQLRSISAIKNGLGLRELRAVLAVAELGSFRRAAAELGYTQSALSHQVLALETALGLPLFHRPGGRAQVRLTPAGEAVCRRARRVFSEVEAVAADAEGAERGECVRLRVGVSQTAAAEIMPPALRAFRSEYPGVEVVLNETDDAAGCRDALRRGDLDLAFSHDPQSEEFVEAVPLLEDPWVILTRRDSPIAELQRPSFDVLHGLDVVAWTHRWRGQLEIEQAWERRGIVPKIVYRTDDNLAFQRLVAAGLGHGCIGRLAARRAVDPTLTWLSPRERLTPRQIVLCYPRNRQLTATAHALMTAIRAQASA